LKIATLILASALLAGLGMSIPVHFKAVSQPLLVRAGEGTRNVRDLASDYVKAGLTGPVRLLWESGLARPTELERTAVVALLEKKPIYLHSGGPAPCYEAFLADLNPPPDLNRASHVMDQFLPEDGLNTALAQLSSSTDATVRALLRVRQIDGWHRFMPVNGYAGQPLDASILTLAMLAQSGCLRPEMAHAITTLADGACAGKPGDLEQLESTLLATLTLGRRTDWTELAELMRCMESPGDMEDAASRIATAPHDEATIFAATVLCGTYAPIGAYIAKHQHGESMTALREAVTDGRGALDVLIHSGDPMYRPPHIARSLEAHFSRTRTNAVTDFAMHHAGIAIVVKNVLIFAAGLALSLAGRCMWMCLIPAPEGFRRACRIHFAAGNLFVAGAFTIILWLSIEPNLLLLTTERPAQAVFEAGSAMTINLSQSHVMNANSLDQASVMSLALFFFVQLAVYIYCVARLRRLKAMDLPAPMKLKLLENEDNLFDLGLYIGLAGTVLAFLMLSMNIIQASLVAAYSSTLFGILFTATLKIVHVRTFRRSLILDAQTAAPQRSDSSKSQA
jgi:hypothetical protein